MASLEEIRDARLKKLQILRDAGMEGYPAETDRNFEISKVVEDFEKLEKEKKEITIAGRVMALRLQGAIGFVDLFDGTGVGENVVSKLQIFLKKGDSLSDKKFDLFVETVDIGDFIEATGTLFVTKRNEKTLQISDWKMLTKSLRPLPEKWHGLQDLDERYRRRYLDLLLNDELRELIFKKTKFWETVRVFFKERGFLEVETPTLESTTGGAEARPFKTHHNDFDIDMFMRISVGELWQKRLMAAGFPKTFEIGKVYRNEGTSPEHLQEFTNMEFYWGYANYRDGMNLVKELYREIAQKVFGKTKFEYNGMTFDLADEWKEINYADEIKKQTDIDIATASEGEIKDKLDKLKVTYQGDNRERLLDTLWKYCRKNISGPAFLVGHPVLVAPLAKKIAPSSKERGQTPLSSNENNFSSEKSDSENEMTPVQEFQPILAGSEVGRGYSELNDPIDQKERFITQGRLLEKGDEEAMMPDFDFVEMLEYGMPPTCGFGFGERLFAILAGKPLRELQTFPLMRPKE